MPLTKIKSLGITDGTVLAADIADGSVTAGKLAAGVGGKVLQVITATDSTERSTTSTSFVTGSNTLSISITPSSISNKIFVITTFGVYGRGYYTIYRDSTNLAGNTGMAVNESDLLGSRSMSILDSPSTTSATTYQVYLRQNNSQTYINTNSIKASITAFEIAG